MLRKNAGECIYRIITQQTNQSPKLFKQRAFLCQKFGALSILPLCLSLPLLSTNWYNQYRNMFPITDLRKYN